ncbi:MAG: hypothetical protein AABX38_00025 [Candidatus Micrarchaeota archaeon]
MIKYKDLAQGAKVIPISRAAPHFIDESVARKPIPPEQMGQMHVLTPRPNWSKLDLENDRIEIFHNLNLEQTLELERLDFVILPNSVIDHILQNPKLREKYAKLGLFPCRTGTWVDLDEENCIIKQDGKTKEIRLHTKNGWYKKDEFGIPSGAPSNEFDPDARYLYRAGNCSEFLVRVAGYIGWPNIYAGTGWSNGLGVACITRETYEKLFVDKI